MHQTYFLFQALDILIHSVSHMYARNVTEPGVRFEVLKKKASGSEGMNRQTSCHAMLSKTRHCEPFTTDNAAADLYWYQRSDAI